MSDYERELGSESGSTSCSSCGAELSLVPDGAEGVLRAENCQNCWPSTPTETAAVVEVRETGSAVDQADLFDEEDDDE